MSAHLPSASFGVRRKLRNCRPGLRPEREFLRQLAFEHIDPMTGNVLLTFTDLELPGNAGFRARPAHVQRLQQQDLRESYSSYRFVRDNAKEAG